MKTIYKLPNIKNSQIFFFAYKKAIFFKYLITYKRTWPELFITVVFNCRSFWSTFSFDRNQKNLQVILPPANTATILVEYTRNLLFNEAASLVLCCLMQDMVTFLCYLKMIMILFSVMVPVEFHSFCSLLGVCIRIKADSFHSATPQGFLWSCNMSKLIVLFITDDSVSGCLLKNWGHILHNYGPLVLILSGCFCLLSGQLVRYDFVKLQLANPTIRYSSQFTLGSVSKIYYFVKLQFANLDTG